jgi:hypothetical protein
MKKQEIEKEIEPNPFWYVKMDLEYLKINKDKITNFKRYNYIDRDNPIFDIDDNLLNFLEKFSFIDWTKYCVENDDWEFRNLSFWYDISLASDEFLLNHKDKIDSWNGLKNGAHQILDLIDNFLEDYNENILSRYDCISRDDLNFLARFLLRLATRLENLEKIKTNKKPKN